jgi:alanine dehydrogenase
MRQALSDIRSYFLSMHPNHRKKNKRKEGNLLYKFHDGIIASMLYFTERDVQELLPMSEAIRLMRLAFERLETGEALNQPRRRLILPTRSTLHYMAASDGKYFGAKIYATNPAHGAHFTFLLYAAEDARPLAHFEANYLGQIRTGAISGLATELMARPDAATLAIIGSGFQARSQLAAMAAVRPIREASVWSRDAEKRERFAAECSAAFQFPVAAAATAEQAVTGKDIVVTATNARDPVIASEWIAPGTHINAMGSNQAARREIPTELVRGAGRIAVDSLEQAKMESGDLLLALPPAEWDQLNIVEVKDLVAGKIPGRANPEEITIFKSNGLAVEDVICAGYVYEKGLELGRGAKSPYS